MTKQKWHVLLSKAHKWIALILGLQILAWTLGGFVMTWLPLYEVRGEHKIREQVPSVFQPTETYLSMNDIIAQTKGQAEQILFMHILDTPVVKLTLKNGERQILHAQTGALISPISKDLAQSIAEADYSPNAKVELVSELNTRNIDYKGPLPVWRVDFADEEETSLYISQTEGRVVARRSNMWRLFDFFWMLHIMDYDERSDFNNPLVITTSLFAVLFSLSGLTLIYFRFFRRDFNFILGKKKANKA